MDHTYIFRPLSNEYILQNENKEEITLSSGDSLLVDLVQGYSHLYDKSSSNYKDSIMKENSWSEIGKIMMCPASECKNRWTRLRERFSKERREIEAEYKSGSGVSYRKGFALYENMKFLNSHVQRRKTLTNIPQNKNNKENIASTTSTLPNLTQNFEDNLFSKERRESETEYKSGIEVSYRKGVLYENMKGLNSHVDQRRALTNIPQNKKNKENVTSTSTLPNLTQNFEADNLFSKERRESETEYKSGIGVSYRKGALYENMKDLNSHVDQRKALTNILQNNKNKENVLSTSTSPNWMENFEEDSTSQSSVLYVDSPTSSNIQKKCYTPTKKPYYTSKKRYKSESDDIEKSLLSLSNTIADKIQNLDKDSQLDAKTDEKDTEDKFLDLIAAEIKQLPENERKKKKKEKINILWN